MENRLLERFIKYVQCGSELHNEQRFCLFLEDELKRLGILFSRQEIGAEIGSNGWNILAKLPGAPEAEPLLFCLHMDTVSPGDNICPVFENGIIRSSGDTILGADGKAGIAIVLEAVERLWERKSTHRPVEILFTICQEANCLGAKYADYSDIKSTQAILMDFSGFGEIGGIVCESPYGRQMTFEFFGRTAHAAMEPEKGGHALKAATRALNGIQVGQIDNDTIIMAGDFVSLSRANVIPRYARFDIEIRSFKKNLLQCHTESMIQIVEDACESFGVSYKVTEEDIAQRILVDSDLAIVRELTEALAKSGIRSKLIPTFGICDAMYLSSQGIQGINIGMGISGLHSSDESISFADMNTMAEVIMNILTVSR